MTPPSTAAALTGGVALLERAVSYMLGSLLLVTPAALANRTPCNKWDLRALLRHLNDSLRTLDEAIAAGRVTLDPADDPGCHQGDQGDQGDLGDLGDLGDTALELVPTLRSRACGMIGAWANAGAPADVSIAGRALSPSVVAAAGAVEIAAHGWDVARACGQDRPIPAELAEELFELCPILVGGTDRPARFAAPVEVSPTAHRSDRLVAFLGRRPSWPD
jgi:uncharacterized protein (TIGR03086 family)